MRNRYMKLVKEHLFEDKKEQKTRLVKVDADELDAKKAELKEKGYYCRDQKSGGFVAKRGEDERIIVKIKD